MKLINLEEVNYEEFFEEGEFKNYVSEERLNEMPLIDAEPVKRGEWVDDFVILKYTRPDEIISYKKCSNCGYKQVVNTFKIIEWEEWYKHHWNPKLPTYCCECGSRNIN